MKAKEKAIELVNKYKPFVYCYSGSGMLINQEDEGVILNNAKQCALIAVDEMMKYCDTDYTKYWKEVKKEIHNL